MMLWSKLVWLKVKLNQLRKHLVIKYGKTKAMVVRLVTILIMPQSTVMVEDTCANDVNDKLFIQDTQIWMNIHTITVN